MEKIMSFNGPINLNHLILWPCSSSQSLSLPEASRGVRHPAVFFWHFSPLGCCLRLSPRRQPEQSTRLGRQRHPQKTSRLRLRFRFDLRKIQHGNSLHSRSCIFICRFIYICIYTYIYIYVYVYLFLEQN